MIVYSDNEMQKKPLIPKTTQFRRIGTWIEYPDVIDFREDDYLNNLEHWVKLPITTTDYIEYCYQVVDNAETFLKIEPLAALSFKQGVIVGSC